MLDIAARFELILSKLQQAVARFLLREAASPYAVWLGTRLYVAATRPSPHRPIPVATWHLLIQRAERLALRFHRLVQSWHAGTLPPIRPARPATKPPSPPRTPSPRLPQERGWINKRIPDAAPCAGLLGVMLQLPDLEAFHAEVPRAGRLLRPISHALGADLPPWLRLPPRPRRTPAPRPAAMPPAVPDRPLQPYVRAAARAWNRHARPARPRATPDLKNRPP